MLRSVIGFVAILPLSGAFALAQPVAILDERGCPCPAPITEPKSEASSNGATSVPDLIAALARSPRLAVALICSQSHFEYAAEDKAEALAAAQALLATSSPQAAGEISRLIACAEPRLQAAYYSARLARLSAGGWPLYTASRHFGGVVSPSRP